MTRWAQVLVALTALALGMTLFLFLRNAAVFDPSTADGGNFESAARGGTAAALPVAPAERDALEGPTIAPPPQHQGRSESQVAISLAAIDEQALAGLRLVWTPLPAAAWPPAQWSSMLVDWESLERKTRIGKLGHDGALVFEAAPEDMGAGPSVLWILQPAHFAARASVAGSGLDDLPLSLPALASAERVRARVVDEQGRPAPEAAVEQVAATEALAAIGDDARAVAELRAFRHVTGTDQEGLAELMPTEFACSVRAWTASSRSAFVPRAGTTTEVVLRPTFALSLSVDERPSATRALDGVLPDGVTATAFLDTANQLTWLATAPIARLGLQPPLEVPLLRAGASARLLVELSGGGLVRHRVQAPWPRPNESIGLGLTAELGLRVPLLVREKASELPVEGVEIGFAWRCEASSLMAVSAQGTSAGDGWLLVDGVREGAVEIHARARGYQTVHEVLDLRPHASPSDAELDPNGRPFGDTELLEVLLTRAGSIEGRVTQSEEPVPAFMISWWPSGSTQQARLERFEDAEGRFELEGVPLGGVTLVASALDRPCGEAVSVEVTQDGVPDLELVLPHGIRGRGRIVDGSSGQPLAGARVLTCGCSEGKATSILGEEVLTGTDGLFELELLSPHCAAFGVLKDGYGTLWDIRVGPWSGAIEFGDVALHAVQDLHVVLHGTDDPAHFRAWITESGNPAGEASFDSEGIAVLPGLHRAQYRLFVEGSNGWTRELGLPFHSMLLPEPWTVAVEVSGERSLQVEVTTPDGTPLDELTAILATTSALGHEELHYGSIEISDDGGARVAFTRLPGSGRAALHLELFTPSANLWSIEHLDLAAVPERIERELHDQILVLHLSDPDGEPLRLARVDTVHPDGGAEFSMALQTDEMGRLVYQRFELDEVLLNVYSDSGRAWFGIPLKIPERATELSLTLPALGTLEVTASDGSDPQASVRLQLRQRGTYYSLVDRTTDSQGAATFSSFGTGGYEIHIASSGYWPTSKAVRIEPGSSRVQVPAYPLGDIELTARSPEGLPVAGLSIALEHAALEESVADWVASDRVHASTGSLRTGSDGRITLRGMPSGTYRWSAGAAQGTFVARARGLTPVTLVTQL